MMTWNEVSVLEVQNEKGTFRMERDTELGPLFTVSNPSIALTMTGLYQIEELHYVLRNQSYARIQHGYFSPSIGSKKVLETLFTRDGQHGEPVYAITFLSEDTTYQYILKAHEWKEMMSLFSYLIETD